MTLLAFRIDSLWCSTVRNRRWFDHPVSGIKIPPCYYNSNHKKANTKGILTIHFFQLQLGRHFAATLADPAAASTETPVHETKDGGANGASGTYGADGAIGGTVEIVRSQGSSIMSTWLQTAIVYLNDTFFVFL